MDDIIASTAKYKTYLRAREDMRYHTYCRNRILQTLNKFITEVDCSDLMEELVYHDEQYKIANEVKP